MPLAVVAGLTAITAISALIRSEHIGVHYWIDEGLSVGIARHHLLAIPGVLRQDGSPPLYYMILAGWMRLVGGSEGHTHLLSLFAAQLSVPAAFWAAVRWRRHAPRPPRAGDARGAPGPPSPQATARGRRPGSRARCARRPSASGACAGPSTGRSPTSGPAARPRRHPRSPRMAARPRLRIVSSADPVPVWRVRSRAPPRRLGLRRARCSLGPVLRPRAPGPQERRPAHIRRPSPTRVRTAPRSRVRQPRADRSERTLPAPTAGGASGAARRRPTTGLECGRREAAGSPNRWLRARLSRLRRTRPAGSLAPAVPIRRTRARAPRRRSHSTLSITSESVGRRDVVKSNRRGRGAMVTVAGAAELAWTVAPPTDGAYGRSRARPQTPGWRPGRPTTPPVLVVPPATPHVPLVGPG